MLLRPHILLATGLLSLSATAATACPNFHRMAPPTTAPGLRVAIDPVDGTLGMPAADEFSLEIVLESDAPVSTYRRADGSVRAQLDERFAEFAVASLGADGKPAWTCVKGLRGAAQFLKSPAVPAHSAAPVAPAPGTVWEEK
ncbi:MAG: hypothetical protein IT348_02850 [Candidatus Eisenbacteria bacterium]|nr:hypothetical protein [Candidatus Eisenbacteria bacterium]